MPRQGPGGQAIARCRVCPTSLVELRRGLAVALWRRGGKTRPPCGQHSGTRLAWDRRAPARPEVLSACHPWDRRAPARPPCGQHSGTRLAWDRRAPARPPCGQHSGTRLVWDRRAPARPAHRYRKLFSALRAVRSGRTSVSITTRIDRLPSFSSTTVPGARFAFTLTKPQLRPLTVKPSGLSGDAML